MVSLEPSGSHGRHRFHPSSWNPRQSSPTFSRKALLGGSDNNVMPYGGVGVPVPTSDCVMSWEEFLANVPGKTWNVIYGIIGDSDLFADKAKLQWTVTPAGRVNRAASFWSDDTNCTNINGDFERKDQTTATWSPVMTGGGLLTANRQDWLISSPPWKNLIFCICYDTTKIVGNKCPQVEVLLAVLDKRPADMNMHGIPDGDFDFTNTDWTAIEKVDELHRRANGTMRYSLVVILSVALVVQAPRPRNGHRHKGNNSRTHNARLGGPRNNILPNGQIGLPMPHENCVITWEQFTRHVVGKTWLAIYGINGDEATNPGKSFKAKLQWTVTPEGRVNRAASLWVDDGCINVNGDFVRQNPTRAIWAPAEEGFLLASNRLDMLVSDDPSKYLIFWICYDTRLSMGGKCAIVEAVILVLDQRVGDSNMDGIPDGDIVLTNTDWRAIERNSKRCIGERLVRDDMLGWEWYWKGPECPFVKE
ncbi:uncharacterized protein LOC128215189 [Mya arenaria]|uniref:uncharacterized protein LOC128215189 n=1 Tax=Mya arenaria TaxID=6604 RepID=UPI0022E1B507|nr:uncharacterized protein LOC128215189 [Mya arenaria]